MPKTIYCIPAFLTVDCVQLGLLQLWLWIDPLQNYPAVTQEGRGLESVKEVS